MRKRVDDKLMINRMNLRWRALFCTAGFAGLAVPVAKAESLTTLAAQADAIVVASTSSRVESDTLEQFDLTVLRTLKGALGVGETVTVRWTRPAGGLGGVRTGAPPGALTTIDLKF